MAVLTVVMDRVPSLTSTTRPVVVILSHKAVSPVYRGVPMFWLICGGARAGLCVGMTQWKVKKSPQVRDRINLFRPVNIRLYCVATLSRPHISSTGECQFLFRRIPNQWHPEWSNPALAICIRRNFGFPARKVPQ
jgi:hypothetical protein